MKNIILLVAFGVGAVVAAVKPHFDKPQTPPFTQEVKKAKDKDGKGATKGKKERKRKEDKKNPAAA